MLLIFLREQNLPPPCTFICCNSTSLWASPSSRRELLFAAVSWPAFTFTQLHYLVFGLIPTSCPWLHCPLSIRDECQLLNIYRCLHQVSNSKTREKWMLSSLNHIGLQEGSHILGKALLTIMPETNYSISGGFQRCCWEPHVIQVLHEKHKGA